MADRPLRSCDTCRGYDDHPRHVIRIGGVLSMRHIDCCASGGCPYCADTLAAAGDVRGQALIDHLDHQRSTPQEA